MGSLYTVQIPFELCAESLSAAQAGERGGAVRIELCEQLQIGGVTPSEVLVGRALAAIKIPIHVLVRPRGGDFVYSVGEFAQIRREISWIKAAGAAGVALGVLLPSGQVDLVRTRELVEWARPMRVVFHRAFDETPDLSAALEAVIATGADSLLTSGGAPDVMTGADQLAALVRQANGRIEIMAGGGMRLETLPDLIARTSVNWVHGSLTRREPGNTPSRNLALPVDSAEPAPEEVIANLESDVRHLVNLLNIATTRG